MRWTLQHAAWCVALVTGINRQIDSFGRNLPPEFLRLDYVPEPFSVRDVVAIARGIWWSLNGRIDRIVAAEAARLLPEQFRGLYLTPEASENRVLQSAAGTDDTTGSNNWALHGSRTAERQTRTMRRPASTILGAIQLV